MKNKMEYYEIAKVIADGVYMSFDEEDDFKMAVKLMLCEIFIEDGREDFSLSEIEDGVYQLLTKVRGGEL